MRAPKGLAAARALECLLGGERATKRGDPSRDVAHGSFLPAKRANVWLGVLLGLLVYSPFHSWRHSHAVHHATAGDPDRRRIGDVLTLTVAEYVVTGAGTLVTLGGLAVVLAGRWGQLADAAVGASGWLLGAAVVLHIGSLVARSEAWNLSVRAAGGTVARRRLYRAASVGYIGNIINGELGFALRIASLRRSAPAEVPKIATLAATEVPLIIVEVTLATLTSFTLVGPLGVAWWAPLGAFVAMVLVTVALRRLVRRRTAGWRKGLSVLGDGATCTRMAGFVRLAVCGQVLRNWLMLQASGIHASIFDATAVLIALAVLGVLPVGPSVGAAAAVLILGAEGVAGVSAAGVMLTATGTAGALAYAAWAYADRRWGHPLRTPARDRPRRMIVGGKSAVASAP